MKAKSRKSTLPAIAEMKDLIEWALTALVLAFEITTPGEYSHRRMRIVQGAARAELSVIHREIPDSPSVDYPRELTKRIVRRANAIINDGLAAPPSLAKCCNF